MEWKGSGFSALATSVLVMLYVGGIDRNTSCAVGEFVHIAIPSGPAFFKAIMMFFLSVCWSVRGKLT